MASMTAPFAGDTADPDAAPPMATRSTAGLFSDPSLAFSFRSRQLCGGIDKEK
jgi:hypothetical protein